MIDRYSAFNNFVSDPGGGEGPLAGLSIGIKANIMVAGLPWTGGMKLFEQRRAERDAEVVRRLRAAGAAILGTLNMHEAALGATTDNPWFGRTINPHRDGFTAGGSSGGSGAAVAAGLVDAALGTDTAGSIRIPASYCGVYGLKPTHGAVSTDGLIFLNPELDVIGPLARDLDVLERAWNVIADVRPASAFGRLVMLAELGGVEVQADVRAAYERTLALIDLPRSEIALPVATTAIRLAALAQTARALIADLGPMRTEREDEISPELHFILDALEAMPEQPALLAQVKALFADALGQDGVMLLPTTSQVAFAHGGSPPPSQADFTVHANVAGLPALSLPAGTDSDGLPIGLQLIGPAGSEACLIALARQLEPALGGAIVLKEDKP